MKKRTHMKEGEKRRTKYMGQRKKERKKERKIIGTNEGR